MKALTKNQEQALRRAEKGRIEENLTLYSSGLSKHLLGRLTSLGLLRYRPYLSPPGWDLTDVGRAALAIGSYDPVTSLYKSTVTGDDKP